MAELVKELDPESPLGEYLGVEVLLTIGRQAEAFRLYSATREEFPQHTETLAFEARLWAEVEPAKSLTSAQMALARGYPLQELAPWIGNALVKSVGEEKSGEAIARFAEVYPDRWLWHRAAMAYVANKQWKEAKSSFLRAIALGNTLESPLQLAIIEYRDLGMAKEACARLEALGKLVRESKTLGSDSQALVESHTALAHLANKDKKLAKAHAEKALTLSVNNEARINQIVEAFKSGNQLNLIGDALLKTVSKNPLLEDAHLALALIATDAKDYPRTVEHLSAAIALAPDRDELYSARGQASYLALQYEYALRDFETAIRQKPDYAPYHYNRACLLSLLGRKLEAYESLKTALFMNQSLRDQAVADSDLENLRLDKEYETRLAQLGIPSQLGFLKKSIQPAVSPEEEKSSQNTTLRTRPGKPE
jgi:tetratricopeptide (TPR) repeat protein